MQEPSLYCVAFQGVVSGLLQGKMLGAGFVSRFLRVGGDILGTAVDCLYGQMFICLIL